MRQTDRPEPERRRPRATEHRSACVGGASYGARMTARLNAVAIVTADMARSLAFYRRLGLALPAELDGEPHADADLGGGVRLMWDTEELIRSLYPDWSRPSGGHAVSLAVECDAPADVDALHDRLVAGGAPSVKQPWDAVWGMRYAVVLDPDGYLVDLYAALG